MFDFGINKVLLANQLLGKSHLETIASYLNQNNQHLWVYLAWTHNFLKLRN